MESQSLLNEVKYSNPFTGGIRLKPAEKSQSLLNEVKYSNLEILEEMAREIEGRNPF